MCILCVTAAAVTVSPTSQATPYSVLSPSFSPIDNNHLSLHVSCLISPCRLSLVAPLHLEIETALLVLLSEIKLGLQLGGEYISPTCVALRPEGNVLLLRVFLCDESEKVNAVFLLLENSGSRQIRTV